MVNTYIDETNSQLDDHETKNGRLRGDIPQNEITENGESSREKKLRMKKEKETLQQDVVQLIKNLAVRLVVLNGRLGWVVHLKIRFDLVLLTF